MCCSWSKREQAFPLASVEHLHRGLHLDPVAFPCPSLDQSLQAGKGFCDTQAGVMCVPSYGRWVRFVSRKSGDKVGWADKNKIYKGLFKN